MDNLGQTPSTVGKCLVITQRPVVLFPESTSDGWLVFQEAVCNNTGAESLGATRLWKRME